MQVMIVASLAVNKCACCTANGNADAAKLDALGRGLGSLMQAVSALHCMARTALTDCAPVCMHSQVDSF